MKLIIDTDPGTDDAVAILIALAHFTDDIYNKANCTRYSKNKKNDILSSHRHL